MDARVTTTDRAPFHVDVAEAPGDVCCRWLRADDGVRLRMAHWATGDRGTVIVFPGRTEYVEKYGPAAAEFASRGFAMAAIDWRGQGLADRLIANRDAGHVLRFVDYQQDVAAMVGALDQAGLPRPWYMLGHSMGGAIGLRALMNGLSVRAAAFSAPMWGITISAPLRPAAWTLSWASRHVGLNQLFAPGTSGRSYVNDDNLADNMLTADAGMWDFLKRQITLHPELSLGGPTLHWLYEALRETRAMAARPSPDLPALTLLGGRERIVDPGRIHERMARWPGGRLEIVRDARHEMMMETPEIRRHFYDTVCAFLGAHG